MHKGALATCLEKTSYRTCAFPSYKKHPRRINELIDTHEIRRNRDQSIAAEQALREVIPVMLGLQLNQ